MGWKRKNFLNIRICQSIHRSNWCIGYIKVTGTKGSTTFNGNPSEEWVWGPALDIASLFEPIPDNTISLTLTPPDNVFNRSNLWII